MSKKVNNYGKMEDEIADTSLFGEFVSTFHRWVSSEEQKSNVKRLQNIGKKRKER
jgi:hypothetical protein